QNWHRNAELYPTHELGPIMTWLDINRGNRMLTLTATASKARGLNEFSRQHGIAERDWHEGDVVKTIIKCANGETIELTHDVSLPHPYSRVGLLEGTKGMWLEDKHSVYIDGVSPNETWEDIGKYYEQYDHPLWKKTGAADFTGGHGGMDWLVMRAFLEAVQNKTGTPLDVYDAAAMMAVSVLSEESIAMGSAPMPIPDFTDGKWIKREPAVKSIFSLAEVDESMF
ncbi:MAG: gfo/Idh/MocA family oxidoreductase, partial [Clostridia bacterium]|nr:gfo/Idh/MocA family oxidoreductase [Clostridia bacterium]